MACPCPRASSWQAHGEEDGLPALQLIKKRSFAQLASQAAREKKHGTALSGDADVPHRDRKQAMQQAMASEPTAALGDPQTHASSEANPA